MKKLLAVVCGLVVAGCDYTVPLADMPALEVDQAVVGLWERTTGGGQAERLLVVPLGKTEYLVGYPLGSEDCMFARAYLVRGAGRTLVQLTWVGTAKGAVPDDTRVYQLAGYEQKGEELKVSLLNPAVVSRDIAAPAELAAALEEHAAAPALFRDAMVFRRVKPDAAP